MNTQNTAIHIKIWHKEFWLMSIATFLLSASVYIQVPALSQWLFETGLPPVEAGCVLGVFGIGMFALRAFCSFLVQRFRRNMVCIWAIVGMMACTAGLLYADRTAGFLTLSFAMSMARFALGAFYGLAQMVLCSTLIIDTTESFQRTEANHISSWFARFALPLGPLVGLMAYSSFGFSGAMVTSMGCALAAIVLICMVKFPFKAPEENSKVIRLDRFYLPQGTLLFVNLLIFTGIIGLLFATQPTPTFYAMMLAGFALALLSQRFVFSNAELKSEVVTGLILIVISLTAMLTRSQAIVAYMSPLFLGCGTGIIGARFLLFFIKLSKHCQRGTSQSTFLLGWEAGISLGMCAGFAFFHDDGKALLAYALALAVVTLVLYVAVTHKWYMANKNR